MRKRTTPTAAAVLAAGALLGCLAASGRLAVAQHKVGQPNAATPTARGRGTGRRQRVVASV